MGRSIDVGGKWINKDEGRMGKCSLVQKVSFLDGGMYPPLLFFPSSVLDGQWDKSEGREGGGSTSTLGRKNI